MNDAHPLAYILESAEQDGDALLLSMLTIGFHKHFKHLDGGVKEQTASSIRVASESHNRIKRFCLNSKWACADSQLQSIDRLLKQHQGSGLDCVVKANVYLTDIVNRYKPMNETCIES